MSHSCHSEVKRSHKSSCHQEKGKLDILFWGSLILVATLYFHFLIGEDTTQTFDWYHTLSYSVYELVNTMWVGILLGVLMVALLAKIPREFVMSVLGTQKGTIGILRATAAGVLLDLCNHGILMVGAKLYERGASLGQVIAFLVASPWNSFSLTLILIALIGLPWTLGFILLSMLIAVVTGLVFDTLVGRGFLPKNQNKTDIPSDFRFWQQAKIGLRQTHFTPSYISKMLLEGIKGSRMVLRWILFGIVLAGLVRAFVSPEQFGTYFGPTLAGLGLTVLIATIMEVCSEGSTPIAADLLTHANAPGNSFAFLMTGVSTDYTEIMVLKDTTKSYKAALFLPMITVPQVFLIGWLINILKGV